MVKICNYSSLIFAGNVTVLLIVSMTTEYWEHRSFNLTMINQTLYKANYTQLKRPTDTKSYFIIWYKKDMLKLPLNQYNIETLYQPPMLARNYFQINENTSSDNSQKHSANIHARLVAGMTVLFEQYGNLFRDCDALEGGVIERLEMTEVRENKCEYLSSREIPSMDKLYAISHLERAACVFALMCMLSMGVGLITGSYGLLGRQNRVLIWASCCSLIAGILLTLSIALFHGKCHILRRTEILSGYLVPHKKIINRSRTYSFGWSFVLAWICVFLCFISSFVWLYKAQDSKNSRTPGIEYVRHRYRRRRYSYIDE